MALSTSIVEYCQASALSQCLSAWKDALTYEDVIDRLGSADFDSSDEDITIWEAYEFEDPSWVAGQIESLFDSYIEVATYALKEGK